MKNNIQVQVDKLNTTHKKKKRWQKVVQILAAIVVFCTTYAMILPAITWESTLICELEEHTHSDKCYKEVIIPETNELICTHEEHEHTDECYEEIKTLICGFAEEVEEAEAEAPAEGEDAAEGETEAAPAKHIHTDECYKIEKVLKCEVEEHKHGNGCFENIPAKTEKKLICGKSEHVHTEACYDAPKAGDDGYYCSYCAHTHGADCYDEDGILRCTIPEHTHTEICKSNIKSDVETAEDWEKTIAKLDLTGNIKKDVITIAESQLGYTESTTNFVLLNGDKMGYTRYGAWYGAPYSDWCAMFCSFCLTYAGAMNYPLHASCTEWINSLKKINAYKAFGTYTPQPGDLIFIDWDKIEDGKTRDADHIGIITKVELNEDGSIAKICTIEGNWGNAVKENEYDYTDKRILGFGIVPETASKSLNLAATGDKLYWLEVNTIDDSSASYLIVSEDGHALGVQNGAKAAMEADLTAVTDCPGYYSSTIGTDFWWKFSTTGYESMQYNVGSPTYSLHLGRNSNTVTNSDSSYSRTTHQLAFTTGTKCWTFTRASGSSSSGTTYYLTFDNGAFSCVTNTTTGNRNMKIYKQVADPTTGELPHITPDPGNAQVVKPDYPDYITPSGAKEGSTSVGEVSGTYYSDPGTSQIENDRYFNDRPADDGKVITDKSVVYGDDDYGVFDNYDPNTFGVELSALGQEYSITAELDVKVPLDVVFVLDTSGSMIDTINDGKTSANIMVESLNNIMHSILEDNEDNRVGVVCYSNGTKKLLDLGRYTADNNKYFDEGLYTDRTAVLTPSSSIQRTDGELYKGTFDYGWQGTFTQEGIANGAQVFFDANDTSVTRTKTKQTDEGVLTATYTAQRRPIFILLSDGEPTFCTNDYNNVLQTTAIHGNGNTGYNNSNNQVEDTSRNGYNNNKGILGYYTVLSAQYYKDQVAAFYNTDAYFYTIGIGFDPNSTNSYEKSVAGDDYKCAVLNPTAGNIARLANCTNGQCLDSAITSATQKDISGRTQYTCRMLYQLLNDSYSGNSVNIGSYTAINGLRAASTNSTPVIKNPYKATGYSYADGAFFSTDTSVSQLTRAFENAVRFTDSFPVYGFILKNNTDIVMSDTIGEGMEIKSDLVLRYGGQNYQPSSVTTNGNVTTYNYVGMYEADDGSGQKTDISSIYAEVINENGKQTVKFHIPDAALPAYSPNLKNDGTSYFYYEELPARLIYQVGLTEEAEEEIIAMNGTGETKTFYTNAWDDSDYAYEGFKPTSKNPYYQNDTYDKSTLNKTTNATDTEDFAWEYTESSNAGNVGTYLGNNGKLEFTADKFDMVPVSLYKVDADGSPITTSKATFDVYSNAALTTKVGTYETNELGKLTIPSLRTGRTYYIKETVAPIGYALKTDAISFSIDDEGNVTGLNSSNIFLTLDDDGNLLFRNEPKTTKIKVTKSWAGTLESGESYPTSVQVRLLADGQPIQSTVRLRSSNSWTYTWNDLQMISPADKHLIKYTVEEIDVPTGYVPIITDDGEGNISITNRKIGETSLSVIKKWDGGEETSVRVELLKNGETTGQYATLNEANDWYHIWEHLPDADETGELTYSVREIAVDGYNTEIHLWTGAGDPYGQSGEETRTPGRTFTSGESYILVFYDFIDGNYALCVNEAGDGLDRVPYDENTPVTDRMLWTASINTSNKVKFTNHAVDSNLALITTTQLGLSTSGLSHRWSVYDGNSEYGIGLYATYNRKNYYMYTQVPEDGTFEASTSNYVPFIPVKYSSTLVEDDCVKGAKHYIVVNTKTEERPVPLTLGFKKVTADNGALSLPKAQFEMYRETGLTTDTLIPQTTDRYGIKVDEWTSTFDEHTVTVNQNGRYYIVETQAPPSYFPLEEPVVYDVTSQGRYRTATVVSHPSSERDSTFTVMNIPNTFKDGERMPATGGIGVNAVYTVGVTLITIALAGIVIAKRKRRISD